MFKEKVKNIINEIFEPEGSPIIPYGIEEGWRDG